MIDRLMRACAGRPRRTLVAAGAVAVLGLLAWLRLPHDVLPPLSDARVTVIAEWMGHPAGEVERELTLPLDQALRGLAGVRAVQAQSMSGMSVLDLRLSGAVDRVQAAVAERLRARRERFPADARWVVGSGADATGWVLQYALVDRQRRHGRAALTRLQRQKVARALQDLPGVAEVATVGAQADELRVEVEVDRLRAARATLDDVARAVRDALPFAPASPAEAIAVLSSARLGGTTVGQVADLRLAPRMAAGFADLDGVLDAVGGVVVARRDADVRAVLAAVSRALASAARQLPEGVELVTVYQRGDVLEGMSRTLWRAVAEEILMVALVVALFLRLRRAVLVPAATLLAVLLATGLALWLAGIPATVVSLAGLAIALGLSMDAEIVMLEAGEQRLATVAPNATAAERRQALLAAAQSVTPAVVVALLITSAGFLPALGFAGETGRLLSPLVLGELFVVLAAALATVTLAPALRGQILGGDVLRPGRLSGWLQGAYRPLVHVALRSPRVTLALGGLAVLSCLPLYLRLGGEFLPEIDEGTLLYMPTTRGDVSPHEAAAVVRAVDGLLTRQPGVASAFGKVGRAETATDPAPYSMAEVTITLRPPQSRPTVEQRRWWSGLIPRALAGPLRWLWPDRRPMRAAELAETLDRLLTVPGWSNAWTQPIRGRIAMVATGVETPVAVRIQAADVQRIDELADAVMIALQKVSGTRAAAYQPSGGGVEWTLEPDPAALAAHHLVESEVRRAFRAGREGLTVGAVGTIAVVVAFPPEQFRLAPGIAALPVAPAVTLGAVALPVASAAPLMLRLENGRRVGYVQVELEAGRDPVGYVAEARRSLAVALRPGESLEWAGQYALAARGRQRLTLVAALSLLLVVGLLWWQLRRLVEVLIVLASVPFALVGSVWALHLLGYQLSPAVWVGMLSLVGLATQTGIVMVVYIDLAFFSRLRRGLVRGPEDILAAHAEGTIARVRPKVMTLTAMGAGLAPLLWATGPGAELVRRVAAPMLGGLLSSAFLTLELVPVLYTLWRTRQLARARREGRTLAEVVGPPPRWSGP